MKTLQNAFDYVLEHGATTEHINDACNIFATSYEEYMTLWHLLTDAFKEKMKMNMEFAERCERMVKLSIATEEEIELASYLCGRSLETLDKIIYIRTGYRTLEQMMECEYGEEDW